MNVLHRLTPFSRRDGLIAVLGIGLVAGLLLYKLGSLVGGLSSQEVAAASAPVGWHGIYNDPLYLPLKAVRSVVFFLCPDHGQFLTRLPNTVFGALAVAAMFYVARVWHGRRTALLATALFVTSAWGLHVSRLASFDVLYLSAIPLLLAANIALHRHPQHWLVFYGTVLLWGSLLYVPGLVWLLAVCLYWQWDDLRAAWGHFSRVWQRTLYILAAAAWLPLLIIGLTRAGQLRLWAGLPGHFQPLVQLLKQFAAVGVHLFIRGPQYPQLWLARAPLLDIFTLVMCVLGIYFYARHPQAFRSRMLASFIATGVILVGLGGSVGLSLLVPVLYVLAAAGVAYMLHEWLQVFPFNPLARGIGLGLVCLAVALAGLYNMRAYFIAWPHTQATRTIFHYHR